MDALSAKRLFDRSADDYDRVNRIMSAGLDRRWRRWVARRSVWRPSASVLELMCGTGEIGVEAAKLGARVQAVDVSPRMASLAARRAREAGVALVTSVADVTVPHGLPAERFDSVALSFGLRYLDDRAGFLGSLHSLLDPCGRLVLLEFCVPPPGPLSTPASLYFFRLMPLLGSALSYGSGLYEYLPESVKRVGSADAIMAEVTAAGFAIVERRSLGFGLVLGLVARPMG